MIVSLLPTHPVLVVRATRTIQALTSDGDDHYGLALGSNGEGPAMRRLVAELEHQADGYTWIRSTGGHAIGLYLRATRDTFSSPWAGE